MRKIAFTLATVALAVASAASGTSVVLHSPADLGTTRLQPGRYTLQIVGDKAVFTSRGQSVEVPVTVEKMGKKFSSTNLVWDGPHLKDIQLGGTDTQLVFGSGSPGGAGGNKAVR
jgi:hypothetical protein